MDAELRKRYVDNCPAFGVDPDNAEDKGFEIAGQECISCGKTDRKMYEACAAECGFSLVEEKETSVTKEASEKADNEEMLKQNMSEIANKGRRKSKSPSVDDDTQTQTETTEPKIEKELADDRTEGDITNVTEPTDSTEDATESPESNDQEEKVVVDAEVEDSSVDTITADDIKWDGAGAYTLTDIDGKSVLVKTDNAEVGDYNLTEIPEHFKKKEKSVADIFDKLDQAVALLSAADKPTADILVAELGVSEEDAELLIERIEQDKLLAKPKKVTKPKAAKEPKQRKRLEVLIDVIKAGKAKTQKEIAEVMSLEVKQTAKQVGGLVAQCLTFAVGIGVMSVDGKNYTINE